MELWGRAEVGVKLFDALKRHWLIAVRVGCEDVVVLAEPARAEVVGIKVIAGALLALPSDVDAKPGLVIFDRCSERSRAEARASSEVVRLVMPCGGQASP